MGHRPRIEAAPAGAIIERIETWQATETHEVVGIRGHQIGEGRIIGPPGELVRDARGLRVQERQPEEPDALLFHSPAVMLSRNTFSP
jgi:hypothetical protein